MTRQLAVLCGGLGTRMAALTGGGQKCLLPVAGRPFLWHVLRAMERWEPDEVLLLCGHESAAVEAFAASLEPARHSLRCLVEDRPLGTIGAIRAATPYLADTFLVVLGDVYPDTGTDPWARLGEVLDRSGAAAVLASAPAADSLDQGNLTVAGDLVVRYDKTVPAPLIDRGIRLLTRAGLAEYAGDSDEVFLGNLVAGRRLAHCPFPGRVLDIGAPDRVGQVVAHLHGEENS